ncbi:MAG: DUF368 domain-containing protein [Bacilli bacterium]|nr:DUF368 domain-containing protein [Bacilli bacterium]
MKDKLILVIKGFFFGIANIIPGVSGGTIAITMGVYEEMIDIISHFFKDLRKSLNFLIPFGIGAIISILVMSKLISFCLDKYPFPTTLFFMGLIIGGIPLLTKKVKNSKIKPINIILFLLTFSLIIGMAFMKEGNNVVSLSNMNMGMYIILFLVGMIAAATMVIPGVSGSFVLMLLGFYKPIVNTVSKLTDFSLLGNNLAILIPFGLGVVMGIVLVAKVLEYLFNHYEVSTYYAILGFIIASIFTLGYSLFGVNISIIQVLIGIILFIISTFIGYKLGDE